MNVSFPQFQPAGFLRENGAPLPLLSYYGLQNPSLRGSTFIGTGAVLFQFFDFSDAVDITIDLKAGTLQGEEDFVAPAKSPARFVLFDGFRLGTREPRFCQYDLWLVNKNGTDKCASAKVNVLYRTR